MPKKKKRINFIPIGILVIASICLLARCFFSFSWSDEAFYLTVVHRLWRGERMLADEWYTTQLSAPLLLPFYAFYQWVNGGNDGVYLFFRLLYWAISTGVAFFTYGKLKKYHSEIASLASALIYLLYSRANIGGMSYYNLTLTCVLLSVLLIYGQVHEKRFSRVKLFLIGILLACAVVNTPFLAVAYIVIAVFFFVRKKYRCYLREILWVIAGTALMAALYLGYVFSNVPLEEILINIPHILNEPEIQSTNPLFALPLVFLRVAWRFKWTIGVTTGLIVYIVWKKKKALLSAKVLQKIVIINVLVFLVNSALSVSLLGCINIAMVLFAIPLLMAFEGRTEIDKKVLYLFGIAGLSISLAFTFSSDTGLDAMAIGFVILAMGAVLLLFELQQIQKSAFFYGVLLVTVSVVIIQSAILRISSVYRDAPLSQLDTEITSGPAKHLYTTQEHKQQYDSLSQAIDRYLREDDIVFYSKSCYWSYLCTNNEYGAPSSWRMAMNSPRLEEYYELNPEKVPTCIFILNPTYGNFESSLIQGNEKADFPNENSLEGYLYDYIMEQRYEVIELECATIYRKDH